jgi:hypothetical protein
MLIPTIPEIDSASRFVLASWWANLPTPRTDEGRDIVERLAIRCEGLGMVDGKGGCAP